MKQAEIDNAKPITSLPERYHVSILILAWGIIALIFQGTGAHGWSYCAARRAAVGPRPLLNSNLTPQKTLTVVDAATLSISSLTPHTVANHLP